MAPRWLPIYGLALAGLIALAVSERPKIGPVDIAVGVFLGWAALSLLWTGDWRAGVLHWQHMAVLFAVALLVHHVRDIDRILLPVLTGAILVIVGLAFVYPHFYGGFGNPNFIAETLVLMLPLVVLLPYKHNKVVLDLAVLAAVISAGAYLLFWNVSNVQHLAFLVWLAVLACMLYRGRSWRLLGAVGLFLAVAALLGWVLGMGSEIATSLLRRAEIWINTGAMIMQHPIVGVGLGSFDYALPRAEHVALLGETFLNNPTDYMGAAHNEYLQLWAELGAVGFALAGWLVWLATRQRWDLTRHAGAGCLITAAAISLVGFPLQNPASGLVVAIGAGLVARQRAPWRVPAVRILSWLAVPMVASLSLYAAAMAQASVIYKYIHVEPVRALQANLRAIEIYPLDPWLRIQAMLSLRAVVQKYSPRVDLSPEAADRVFEIATTAVPEQPGVLLSRVEYMINSNRYTETEEMERLFDILHRVGPLYPQVVALESVYAVLVGDEVRAERAVLDTMALPGGPELFVSMGFLRREEPLQ